MVSAREEKAWERTQKRKDRVRESELKTARRKNGNEAERRKENSQHCPSIWFLYPTIIPLPLSFQQIYCLLFSSNLEVRFQAELHLALLSVCRWECMYLDNTTVLGAENSNTKHSGSLGSEAYNARGTGASVEGRDISRATSWRLLIHSIFRWRSCFRSRRLSFNSSLVITSAPNYFVLSETLISSKLFP